MPITATRPEYLLLLPVCAALLWWAARGSFAALSGLRAWTAWLLRCLLVLALILALAGVQLVRVNRDLVVVFALDSSHSIATESREEALEFIRKATLSSHREDRGALVMFGRDAVVETESLRRGAAVQPTSTPDPGHTDLAGVLRLAVGLIPPDRAGRIVLLSDGNENVGAVEQEALLARSRRVPVDVVPLKTRAIRDALVRGVRTPSDARQGEPFDVSVDLDSRSPVSGRVTVLVDGKPVSRSKAPLAAGRSGLRIPLTLDEPGFHRVDVLLESPEDGPQENNSGTSFVRVAGRPRVLLAGSVDEDLEYLARALEVQGIDVRTGNASALPTSPAEIESYDAVVLANIPAYKLESRQMMLLRNSVRDLGAGLCMIGGDYSFGPGGYFQTPIEEALPVTMDISRRRVFPASAVVIVVDTSGSMGMIEGGVEKIQLAAEAAVAVADLLQPYDSIGVIAVDTNPTQVCPLRKIESGSGVKSDIRSLRAGGGGIYVRTGLEAAYGVLKDYPAAIRHVILLADGNDSEQQEGAMDVVKALRAKRITTTAVSIGEGVDVPFLKGVAASGKGQFYVARSAHDLKRIFTRETLTVAKSAIVEEPFRARPGDASPVTSGLGWGSAPPLLGYVMTSSRDLASVPLVTHKDDPLLAHWQYGLGRSVAFTSDASNRWSAAWLDWPQFPRFWSQAIRWCLRREPDSSLRPSVEIAGNSARLVVDALDASERAINGLELRAAVSRPDGSEAETLLEQTGPGRYEAAVLTPATGAYVAGVSAQGPGGFSARTTVGFAVAYPPDFADTEPDEALLRRLARETGGRVLEGPEGVFELPARLPTTHHDIWAALLWAAALLLPLDVAVRRLIITREDLAPFVALVRAVGKATHRGREREHTATMDRLLTRKSRGEEAPKPGTIPGPVRPETLIPPTPPQSVLPEEPPSAAPPEPRPSGEPTRTTSRLLERKRRLRGGDKPPED